MLRCILQALVPRQAEDSHKATDTTMDDFDSYILRLPGELRISIYEYALQEPELYLENWISTSRAPVGKALLDRKRGAQPGITRVSKQVRAETLPVFYSINTFVFD